MPIFQNLFALSRTGSTLQEMDAFFFLNQNLIWHETAYSALRQAQEGQHKMRWVVEARSLCHTIKT